MNDDDCHARTAVGSSACDARRNECNGATQEIHETVNPSMQHTCVMRQNSTPVHSRRHEFELDQEGLDGRHAAQTVVFGQRHRPPAAYCGCGQTKGETALEHSALQRHAPVGVALHLEICAVLAGGQTLEPPYAPTSRHDVHRRPVTHVARVRRSGGGDHATKGRQWSCTTKQRC